MRKVIVSMNVTLDGFMSGPDCELDWHFQCWTDEMAVSLCQQLGNADTILLGRVTYSAMARYWPAKASDLSIPREDIAFADMMNKYDKIVFSKTLSTPGWQNSRIIRGNARQEVLKLKHQEGKDMIIYGSSRLVASLMRYGLIDTYVLWLHPVILGRGKPLFPKLQERQGMKLRHSRAFSSGVVLLAYDKQFPGADE